MQLSSLFEASKYQILLNFSLIRFFSTFYTMLETVDLKFDDEIMFISTTATKNQYFDYKFILFVVVIGSVVSSKKKENKLKLL